MFLIPQELAERAKLRAQLQVAVAERQQTSQAFAAGIMALTPQPASAAAAPAGPKASMAAAARGNVDPTVPCITSQTPDSVAAAIIRASSMVGSEQHSRLMESICPAAAAAADGAWPAIAQSLDRTGGIQTQAVSSSSVQKEDRPRDKV